ncbi:MAG: hypothetical protein KC503_08790 [Myxococcales bacterium]|nr:hypothetical protein [Myxococcales bacterium]
MGNKDPVLTMLADSGFSAVRLPRERLPVLTLAERSGSSLRRLGALGELFNTGAEPIPEVEADIATPQLAGKQTRSLELSLGLSLLKGVLAALGGGTAGIEAKYSKAVALTFEFHDVRMDQISIIALDKFLATAEVNPHAQNTKRLLDADELYVLATVLKSNNLKVSAKDEGNVDVGVKVDEIKQLVGAKVGVKASSAGESALTFSGDPRLVFAFQAVQLRYEDGHYKALRQLDAGELAVAGSGDKQGLPSTKRVSYFAAGSPFAALRDEDGDDDDHDDASNGGAA